MKFKVNIKGKIKAISGGKAAQKINWAGAVIIGFRDNHPFLFIIAAVILLILVGIYSLNRPSMKWISGEKKMYAFRFITHIDQDPSLNDGEHISASTTLVSGVLNMNVYEAGSKGAHVGFQPTLVNYYTGASRDKAMEDLFNSLFFAEFTPDGKIIKTQFSNNISSEEEPLLAGLVNTFACVIDPGFIGGWKTDEEDSMGEFKAQYSYPRLLPFLHEISKKRVHYFYENDLAHLNADEMSARIKIIRSDHKFKLSKTSWMGSYSGKEILDLYIKHKRIMRIERTMKLDEIDYTPDDKLAIWGGGDHETVIKEYATQEKDELPAWEEARRDYMEGKYGDRPLSDVMGPFTGHAGDNLISYKDAKAVMDYLLANPDKIDDVGRMISGGSLASGAASMLLNVLSRVGTKVAQNTLFNVSQREELGEMLRINALTNLGEVKKELDSALLDKMIAVHQDRPSAAVDRDEAFYCNTMLIAMGRLANTADKGSTDEASNEAKKIGDYIDKELEAAGSGDTDGKLPATFYAVYNARDPRYIPKLENYMSSDNADIRKYSAIALCHIKDEKAALVLKESLESEDNPSVKSEIIRSLSYHPFDEDVCDHITSEFSSTASEKVRGSMIDYLITTGNSNEDYMEDLEEFLEDETAEGNRTRIFTALYTDLYK